MPCGSWSKSDGFLPPHPRVVIAAMILWMEMYHDRAIASTQIWFQLIPGRNAIISAVRSLRRWYDIHHPPLARRGRAWGAQRSRNGRALLDAKLGSICGHTCCLVRPLAPRATVAPARPPSEPGRGAGQSPLCPAALRPEMRPETDVDPPTTQPVDGRVRDEILSPASARANP